VLDKPALDSTGPLQPVEDDSSRRYDVFGTANFFNFYPLAVAIEYLQKVGIPDIQFHNDGLVEQSIKGLMSAGYRVISPQKKGERSGVVFFSHQDPDKNGKIFNQLLEQGIYPALWKGNLRITPHLYNTAQDIEKLISAIKKTG
jgi:selenocysteine lyase/cysteine desulfurase